MTMHEHPDQRPPLERPEFLVDGCPRCEEYESDMGLHFDAPRFIAFWRHMIDVEFEDEGGYMSVLDRQLGRKLFYVALALHRAFGLTAQDLRFEIDAGSAVNREDRR